MEHWAKMGQQDLFKKEIITCVLLQNFCEGLYRLYKDFKNILDKGYRGYKGLDRFFLKKTRCRTEAKKI